MKGGLGAQEDAAAGTRAQTGAPAWGTGRQMVTVQFAPDSLFPLHQRPLGAEAGEGWGAAE